jgi:hypothetical protein
MGCAHSRPNSVPLSFLLPHQRTRPQVRQLQQHKRRHVKTRAATTIAIAGKINNSSLNIAARISATLQTRPATHVRGTFIQPVARRMDVYRVLPIWFFSYFTNDSDLHMRASLLHVRGYASNFPDVPLAKKKTSRIAAYAMNAIITGSPASIFIVTGKAMIATIAENNATIKTKMEATRL